MSIYDIMYSARDRRAKADKQPEESQKLEALLKPENDKPRKVVPYFYDTTEKGLDEKLFGFKLF